MVTTHSMPAPAPAQDPISHDFAQISADGEYVRRLTVSYGARSVHEPDGRLISAPMLRLQGAWLKRAGFDVGVPVTVQVSPGRLVIEVTEPDRVPHADVLAAIARVADGDLPKRDLHRFVRDFRRRRSR